jgi:CDP-glucose 4,6-dehydratase
MGPLSMKDALDSYAGKRVLLTGHTGFKGTWMTFLLKEIGADVMGVALAPAMGPSHFEMLGLADQITHVTADIREPIALKSALDSFQPEYVFHLAAQALVKPSYHDPVLTFSTNVMGSVNLLEAVRHCPSVRSLVYITSDKCYENVEWIWGYRENDRMGGHDPYSASKGAAELVFSAYARSYFGGRSELGAASARAGNVIGGGDWALDRIVPDCVRAAERRERVILRSPRATRPWQHVLEPIAGYLLLGARLREYPREFEGSWNFGPPSTEVRTVEEVANEIARAFGIEAPVSDPATGHHHEAQLLQLNCDKAHQLLGWRPRWGVGQTVAATAAWYSAVSSGADPVRVTRGQLRDYFPELS